MATLSMHTIQRRGRNQLFVPNWRSQERLPFARPKNMLYELVLTEGAKTHDRNIQNAGKSSQHIQDHNIRKLKSKCLTSSPSPDPDQEYLPQYRSKHFFPIHF